MSAADRWLRAGIVGRPHGLDGSFHVNSPVAGLLDVGLEVLVDGVARRVDRVAGHDRRLILRLQGSEGRDAAEQLRGQEILVAREAAPPLGEDEWWATDLEGCSVRDGSREVGTVARLLELPSCEVLEVTRSDDPTAPDLLVPLIKDAVRDVDLSERVIDVDLRFLGE
ncbi:MAG TPA: ribosome maturation factor RimM [Solirubrobacteraceae bacterium]|nr:ribosome maturation factor RimM [Solirubrobacteraceae bacterium]